MKFKVTGTVHKILDDQVYSETFSKREFILAVTENEYTEYIKFQLVNDRRGQIANVTEGDNVTVDFNLKGREVERSGEVIYFTNLDAWRVTHS